MTRLLGWMLSIVLHVTAIALAIAWPGFMPVNHEFRENVYTVDIVQLEAASQAPAPPEPCPAPEPISPESAPTSQPTTDTPEPSVPETPPTPEPRSPKKASKSPRPTMPAPPAPEIAEGEVAVSPVKREGALKSVVVKNPAPPSNPVAAMPADIHLGKGEIKEGAEGRFLQSIPGLGRDTYDRTDALGFFQDNGETLGILQDKETRDLLLVEMDKGVVHHLLPMNKYIYSYGDAEGRVQGSVTFLGDGADLYRFMWLDSQNRAHFPTRVPAREEQAEIGATDGALPARLVLPRDFAAGPGLVMLHVGECQPEETRLTLARGMAARGVAVLSLASRDCEGVPGEASPESLAADARAGFEALRERTQASPAGLYLWGDDVRKVLAGLEVPEASFVAACSCDATATALAGEDLGGISCPFLWLQAGESDAEAGRLERLEGALALMGRAARLELLSENEAARKLGGLGVALTAARRAADFALAQAGGS